MGLLDDIEEFGEDVGDGIKNGAQAIGQAAEDAWNEVTGAGEDAANAAGEAVEDGWNTLTQLAEDAVDKANDLVKDAADAAAKLADALEHAAGDVYHAGTGVVDAIAGGVVDAGEWGIGAFETVGSGIGEGLEWVGNEYGEPITSWVTDTLSDYGKEIGAAFAGSFISSLFGGSGENKEQGPVADGSDIGGPYSGGMAGADSGESEVGTVGQALSTVDDGGSSFFGNLADASHDARGLLAPDLSNILTRQRCQRVRCGLSSERGRFCLTLTGKRSRVTLANGRAFAYRLLPKHDNCQPATVLRAPKAVDRDLLKSHSPSLALTFLSYQLP